MEKKELGKQIITLVDKFINLLASALIPEAMEKKNGYLRGRIGEVAAEPIDDYDGFVVDDEDSALDDDTGPF